MLGDAVVLPGDEVHGATGFLRGHGTYVSQGETLIASLCGRVARVNKLVSVVPHRKRFHGEVGDLVVGRVTEVGAKRWKVNVRAAQDAVLQLSSVNLPSGVQRIRTHEDQLQMRSMYAEGDLISAEVQAVKGDGSLALHTRSLRYGKLANGCLMAVPPALVKRLKQHYLSLGIGVSIILGVNGFIWITRDTEGAAEDTVMNEDKAALAEELQEMRNRHEAEEIPPEVRRKIARVRNAIRALARSFCSVTPTSIMRVYEGSLREGIEVHAMLGPDFPAMAAAWAEEMGTADASSRKGF